MESGAAKTERQTARKRLPTSELDISAPDRKELVSSA
jgi:hypothetical protein